MNPFDNPLSSHQDPQFMSLEAAQAITLKSTQRCEEKRFAHRKGWEEAQRESHSRRYEAALEEEELENRFIPTFAREKRDAQDDARFAHHKEFDEILDLKTHEDYLRARRAWERRHRVEDVELNVSVGADEFQLSEMTGRQIWGALVALFIAMVYGSAAAQVGPAALLGAPVAVLSWFMIMRFSFLYLGTFSSGGGSRGVSGSAI